MMDGALAAALDSLERRHPELAGWLTVADLHRHRELVGQAMHGTLEQLRVESFPRALPSLGRADAPRGRDAAQPARGLAGGLLGARPDVVGAPSDVDPVVDRLLERGHLVGAIT